MRLNADGTRLPDDPHLTWLRGEYLTAPDHWRTVFDRCNVLLRLPKTNLTARVYLASVIGSLGTPPGEPIFDAMPDTPHADYLEAVIRSAWSQPCEERHARACHERRELDPECRRDGAFAVDALVRMGRTGEVPAEQLDEWLEQRVNRAEAPRRWRNLCWMSRDARLRQTLRAKLSAEAFVRESADDVKAILDARRLSDLEEQRGVRDVDDSVKPSSIESPTPLDGAAAPMSLDESIAPGAANAVALIVASCDVADRLLDRSMANVPVGTLLPDDPHEAWTRTDRLYTQSPLSKAYGVMLALLERR
ncbi:hypothetical protein [Botrimarina mediterranea]|nr:hypothetical protein [Botrimarina mediterranea]